jgi:hypothetical protein
MDYVIAAITVRLIQLVLYHKWSNVVNSGIPYRCELKNIRAREANVNRVGMLPSGLTARCDSI